MYTLLCSRALELFFLLFDKRRTNTNNLNNAKYIYDYVMLSNEKKKKRRKNRINLKKMEKWEIKENKDLHIPIQNVGEP